MQAVKSVTLTHLALEYTSRKLTAKGKKDRESIHSATEPSATFKPLGVTTAKGDTHNIKTVESYQRLLELVAQTAALNPNYQLY